jgi:hypothetical protein
VLLLLLSVLELARKAVFIRGGASLEPHFVRKHTGQLEELAIFYFTGAIAIYGNSRGSMAR